MSLGSRLGDTFASLHDGIDPYLLDPVALSVALIRGQYTHRVNGVEETFLVDGFWEVASLLHTFRKEAPVFEDLIETVRPTDTFYDVGANLGAFTCFASALITEGEVVAFEPHPTNTTKLRRNLKRNGHDVSVYDYALSDEAGTASLSVDLGRAGNQRHALAAGTAEGRTIEVETIPGDALVRRGDVPQPTVVKIDVEGAEQRVIDGLQTSLSRSECRIVYCEIHPELMSEYGGDPEAIRAALTDAGFTLERIHESGGQSYLRGVK